MPVYGVERYIARAIESVQAQTYANWELLIVNDGTLDHSREIAAKYAASDKRMRIIDKPNGGLSDARNAGLSNVTGDYIHFFDSDDWIEPDFFERMVGVLDKTGRNMAVCGYYVDTVDPEGKLSAQSVRMDLEGPAVSRDDYFNLMELYMNYAWNKLYCRSFIEENHLLFEKGLWLIEDCEFISRVLACRPTIAFVNYAGYHYIQRNDETLSKKYNSNVTGFIRRKMGMYKPVLRALNAPETVVDEIFEDMRTYSSAYLLKQMMRALSLKDLRAQASSLYNDTLLHPGKVSLKRCTNVKEWMILMLAKARCFRLLSLIGKYQ